VFPFLSVKWLFFPLTFPVAPFFPISLFTRFGHCNPLHCQKTLPPVFDSLPIAVFSPPPAFIFFSFPVILFRIGQLPIHPPWTFFTSFYQRGSPASSDQKYRCGISWPGKRGWLPSSSAFRLLFPPLQRNTTTSLSFNSCFFTFSQHPWSGLFERQCYALSLLISKSGSDPFRPY